MRVTPGSDRVEGEDEVSHVVGGAHGVADVDVENPLLDGVEGDDDVGHLDPGFPPVQRGAHLVGDAPRGGPVGGREHVVVDATTELGAHRTLARRGAKHEPDRLLDLLVPLDHRDPAGRTDPHGEGPAAPDEPLAHSTPPMTTFGADQDGGPARGPIAHAGGGQPTDQHLAGGPRRAGQDHVRRAERHVGRHDTRVHAANHGRGLAADEHGGDRGRGDGRRRGDHTAM